MAYNLAAAAAVGAVPSQWGGVFGQELGAQLGVPRAQLGASAAFARQALAAAPPSPLPDLPSTAVGKAVGTAVGTSDAEQLTALLGRLSVEELINATAAVATAAAARFRGASGGAHGGAPAVTAADAAEEDPHEVKLRALRPLHPERLDMALRELEAGAAPGAALHLEGLVWLATQPGLQGVLRTADKAAAPAAPNAADAPNAALSSRYLLEPGDPWWACIPKAKWPAGLADEIGPLWHEPHGDRQTELSIRSPHAAQRARAHHLLKACILTEHETAALLDETKLYGYATAEMEDPFAPAWKPLLQAENAFRIEDEVRAAFARATRGGVRIASPLSIKACAPCRE